MQFVSQKLENSLRQFVRRKLTDAVRTSKTWKLTAFTGIEITDSHLSTPAFIAMVESFHLCSAVRRKGSASKPKFDDGILGKAWHQWYARRG